MLSAFQAWSAVRFCSPPSSATNCHSLSPPPRVSPATSMKNSVWLACSIPVDVPREVPRSAVTYSRTLAHLRSWITDLKCAPAYSSDYGVRFFMLFDCSFLYSKKCLFYMYRLRWIYSCSPEFQCKTYSKNYYHSNFWSNTFYAFEGRILRSPIS